MIINIEKLSILTALMMWVALALTIISLCDYIIKNKQVIGQTK
jgi:CDP-diacylglycerol--glycerol-3-phosphate 3-phosphatidyltransferase